MASSTSTSSSFSPGLQWRCRCTSHLHLACSVVRLIFCSQASLWPIDIIIKHGELLVAFSAALRVCGPSITLLLGVARTCKFPGRFLLNHHNGHRPVTFFFIADIGLPRLQRRFEAYKLWCTHALELEKIYIPTIAKLLSLGNCVYSCRGCVRRNDENCVFRALL